MVGNAAPPKNSRSVCTHLRSLNRGCRFVQVVDRNREGILVPQAALVGAADADAVAVLGLVVGAGGDSQAAAADVERSVVRAARPGYQRVGERVASVRVIGPFFRTCAGRYLPPCGGWGATWLPSSSAVCAGSSGLSERAPSYFAAFCPPPCGCSPTPRGSPPPGNAVAASPSGPGAW